MRAGRESLTRGGVGLITIMGGVGLDNCYVQPAGNLLAFEPHPRAPADGIFLPACLLALCARTCIMKGRSVSSVAAMA